MISRALQLVHNFINTGHERSIIAKRNIFTMFIIKGVTITISFLYVPLLIKTLDTYNYGIWLTITSIFSWLNLFDVGLGNGLRNKLAEALAQNDQKKAKTYISTGYAGIAALSILIALSFIFVSSHVSWSKIINVPDEMDEELTKLINIVFLFYCFQFILLLLNSILLAFQMSAQSSMIIMFGQILSFIVVAGAALIIPDISLLNLGFIISISPVMILIGFTIYLFRGKLKIYRPGFQYIQFNYLKDILGLGIKFFILQLITILFYQSSNIIIAHNIGQKVVTEYNIAYKYIGVISMIFTIVITPFWSSVTDAYYKGDIEWIKNAVLKLNKIWLLLSVIGLGLFLASDVLYKFWLGNTIHANSSTLGLTLIYFILHMFYGSYGYLLNGIGKVKLQLVITIIVACIYLPLVLLLSKWIGLTGVLSSMIFVALINSIWSKIQFNKIISGKATGIWNK